MSLNYEQEELILTTKDYINRFITITDDILNKIRMDDKESYNLLESVVEGLQWLSGSIEILNSNRLINVSNLDLNPIYISIIEAFNNSDYVLICDLIEFEVFLLLNQVLEELSI